ncbi:DUF3907 family protein [Anaerobacillus sp. HL2]|nr:DUF3907 family protein [Anaerobacillus sp. HL2]
MFCDEGKNSCEVILNGNTFSEGCSRKNFILDFPQICIRRVFNPRIENWYEDSRAAILGKNAIKFSYPVPESLKVMMKSIEGPFQTIREELEYYETDYQTKVIQTK